MPRPIWEIFRDGNHTPVGWVNHSPSTRFSIYSPGPSPDADLVWDQERGLVWARNANLLRQSFNWLDANTEARSKVKLAHRQGWRLPSAEELATLIDTRQDPMLPVGHPFINVQAGTSEPTYWTSTDHENPDAAAWFINFNQWAGGIGLGNKTILGFV